MNNKGITKEFEIKGLFFQITKMENPDWTDPRDVYQMSVVYPDGTIYNITEDLGVGYEGSEAACCWDAMLWMERNVF